MKTPLLYGSLIAIIGALLTFGLYFAGLHDTPEKLKSTQAITIAVLVTAHIVLVALAMRERRTTYPLNRDWTYGSALGVGILTGIVSTILGAILGFVYFGIVNPQFGDVSFQVWYSQMEAKGMPAARLEGASAFMHRIYSPAGLTLASLINGAIATVVIALIVAIFFRKRTVVETTIAAEPPAV